MPFRCLCTICFSVLSGFLGLQAASSAGLAGPIQILRSVASEGHGNSAATAAWKQVAAADGKSIPAILVAMDGANDYALNWLRSAVEAVAQRELAAGHKLPVTGLEKFLRDPKHHPRARRMAFEMIAKAEPALAQKLLPSFANDPSNELRRDAVQHLADDATKQTATDKPAAIAGLKQALSFAREADQIDDVAKKLVELGEKVDLQKVFGWVTRWKLIGPFDNTGGAGFAKAYAPEVQLDLVAEADGKTGKVRWVDQVTKSDYGLVDFNVPFTSLKEVAGYAYTEIWSDTARPVQVRLGCDNGWKVWLNGKFLFGRDEYHRNVEIDQYRLAANLKPGKNILLVKCTQNEQVEDWTKTWEFQLRLTDEQGTPIISTK